MKKLLFMVFILILIFGLVVCGGKDKDEKKFVVGVFNVLYVVILEKVKLLFEKKGIELEIKKF